MNHKVGEIITLPNGIKLEVVESGSCRKCYYHNIWGWNEECGIRRNNSTLGGCGMNGNYRSCDYKQIIYKEIK